MYPSQEKRMERKFCSYECRNNSYRKTVEKICKTCGSVFDTVPAEIKKGGGKYCSKKCLYACSEWREKQSEVHKAFPSRYWSNKKRPEISGTKHYNWRGGVSSERENKEYYQWRRDVLARDGEMCRINNHDCSGRLEVHHILNFSEYPELRYDTSNGIVLCKVHHPRKRIDEERLVPFFRELLLISK